VTDEEIAQALLLAGDRGPTRLPADRGSCVHEDRLWDLARGALDPDDTAQILDHTLECPDCSLALRVAHETFAASGMPSEAGRQRGATDPREGMWARLAGGILRPAPALVYLVLLLASYPFYRVFAPAMAPPVAPSAAVPAPSTALPSPAPGLRNLRILRITGDLSLRGGTAPPEPVRVRLGEGELLVLKLFPEIEDLPREPGGALRVRVLHGDDVVAEATRRVADLDPDQSVSLLLDRERLGAGTTYTVEVAATASAHPSSPPILRQSFRLDRD
jgi:hypothetical protein